MQRLPREMKQTHEQKFVEKCIRILSEVPMYSGARHFGRPFMTSYQLAITFKHLYPDEFAQLGLPIGSESANETSLARYVAQNLSEAVKQGHAHIEIGLLSYEHLEDITLDNDGEIIRPTRFPVTMFRYID